MNSSCGPILNWISENSKHSVHVPPNNDVITYFDNNQVLARNWRVHFDAKAILSAIITTIHAFPFHPCNVQFHPGLSPRSDIGCIKKISVSHGNCLYPFFLGPQKVFAHSGKISFQKDCPSLRKSRNTNWPAILIISVL